MRILTAFLLFSSTAIAQENLVLGGTVQDATSREHLAYANIRVLGTSQGTVANADGVYRLILWPGKRTLVASCLGYKPDTLHVILTQDEVRNFALTPSDIILPEIVVSSEDPAIEIIRRAIANKRTWIERLKNFEMDAFTRQVLKRDTAIASITESFTKGYWQQGDTLREIVKQKRQTENVKSEFNVASVGKILNFNDDEIRFVGYTFVGPTADDALDYYDYKLLKTRGSYGREVYEIKLIPRRRTTPLFEGSITIAGDSYALVGVDVQPNEAFSIPFVKESVLRYRQQFSLYDNSFWMPVDIRIDVAAVIRFAIISIPKITFSQTSVITNYAVNTTIPDSIFRKLRLTVDSLAISKLDTTFWQVNAVLPLTLEEQQAYKTLDSTNTLDVQFRPRGFAINIGTGDGDAISILNYLDLSFNRVEGFHVGGKVELDNLSTIADARAGIAYGSSDKRMKYEFGATVFTSPQRTFGFGVDVYRALDHRPDQGYYGALFNSFTSLLAKNDYRDYYLTEGGRLFLTFQPSEKIRLDVSYVNEEHRSVQRNTDFSLLARSSSYRPNPDAEYFKSLEVFRFEGRFGEKEVPFEIVSANAFRFSIEGSLGKREFSRYYGIGSFSFPTFSRSHLLPPTLRGKISIGRSTSGLPPQRFFDLESASSNFAPFGVFRAMDVKEFSGERFIAANLEHNFRSLPFLALGIPLLYENNIEFIVHGGAAQIWTDSFTLRNGLLIPFGKPTNGWYSEIGFGFSRIFDLLRADLTWRLSEPGNFRFTLGVANLF